MLDPKNDYAFKRIFYHEDIIKDFLNAILVKQPHNQIKTVTYLSIEQLAEMATGRSSRLDIKCTDENGDTYIVEMQRGSVCGFEKRLAFYASRAYSEQLDIGEAYYNLCPVISIAILGERLFKDHENFITYHSIHDESSHDKTFQMFRFICIELPKFKKTMYDNLIEEWVYFFQKAQTLDMIPPGSHVTHAYEVLHQISMTPYEKMAYDNAEKAHRDQLAREETAELKGIAIGEERGEKKKALEMAREMKADNEPMAKIIKYTKLTLEEIKKA
jgi:predicted transposase/invertase (TIGR01784 family)